MENQTNYNNEIEVCISTHLSTFESEFRNSLSTPRLSQKKGCAYKKSVYSPFLKLFVYCWPLNVDWSTDRQTDNSYRSRFLHSIPVNYVCQFWIVARWLIWCVHLLNLCLWLQTDHDNNFVVLTFFGHGNKTHKNQRIDHFSLSWILQNRIKSGS